MIRRNIFLPSARLHIGFPWANLWTQRPVAVEEKPDVKIVTMSAGAAVDTAGRFGSVSA